MEGVMLRVRPNLDLVPSNLKLAYLEPRLITQISRENKLKNALMSVLSTYDIILIDCPPSLGILTVNAFSAAQEVLIPMAAEFFAMVGVGLLLETLGQMRAELNPGLGVVGIVPTRVNRTRHAQEVVEQAKEELGQTLRFFSPIPEAVAVRDASAAGIPVSEYQASSPAAKAYRTVAKELLS
jgi:chromosome partitioning protein